MLLVAPLTDQIHQQCKKYRRGPAAPSLWEQFLSFLSGAIPSFSLWVNTGVRLINGKLFKSKQATLSSLCHVLCGLCIEICLLCAVIDDFLCALPNFGRYSRKKNDMLSFYCVLLNNDFYRFLCIHKWWKYVATRRCFTQSLALTLWETSFSSAAEDFCTVHVCLGANKLTY